MLNIILRPLAFTFVTMVSLLLSITIAHASVIDIHKVQVHEFPNSTDGNFYTIKNLNEFTSITEFGVTTDQSSLTSDNAFIDAIYDLSADSFGPVWSAQFFTISDWNASFSFDYGDFNSVFGTDPNYTGVNWYYFDQAKYDALGTSLAKSEFFINAEESIGTAAGSYFRFNSNIAPESEFAAFNSSNPISVQLIGKGELSSSIITISEPHVLALFLISMFGLIYFRRKKLAIKK